MVVCVHCEECAVNDIDFDEKQRHPAVSYSLIFPIIMRLTHDVNATFQKVAAVCFAPAAVACVLSLSALTVYKCTSLPFPERRIDRDLQGLGWLCRRYLSNDV